MKFLKKNGLWLIILAFLIGMVQWRHFSGSGRVHSFSTSSETSGAYVYLPATFMYGFLQNDFPRNAEAKARQGFVFSVNQSGQPRLYTRYTYGTALCQLPFFLIARGFANDEDAADAFSAPYYSMIELAGIFYLFFGLLFFWKYLRTIFNERISLYALLASMAGSGLLAAGILEPGATHVYSFFWFSLFLWSFRKYILAEYQNSRAHFWLSLSFAMILVVKPSNALFLTVIFFMDIFNKVDFMTRVKLIFKRKFYQPVLFLTVLLMLPQMAYWKYAQGVVVPAHYFPAFSGSIFGPQLPKLWFSASGGLFLYIPVFLLSIAGMVYMWRKRITNFTLLIWMFLLLSFLLAVRWTNAESFGGMSAGFSEYMVLFMLPVAYLMRRLTVESAGLRLFFYGLLIIACGIQLKLVFAHFPGLSMEPWDWNTYVNMLF